MNKQKSQKNSDVFDLVADALEDVGEKKIPAYSHGHESAHWSEDHQEGQLAIDVLDVGSDIVVVSTMAGADPEKIEVYVHNDLLTIRGVRPNPMEVDSRSHDEYLYQECFWGKFSRTIVLPVDVAEDIASAEYKNGVLTVRIPKHHKNKKIPVTIVED